MSSTTLMVTQQPSAETSKTKWRTLAGNSNMSRKSYSRYVMTNRDVLFNVLVAKRAKTRQVPIIWIDNDDEGVLYPHEDALAISAYMPSKKFDQILVDTGSSVDVLCKSTLNEIDTMSLRLENTSTSLKRFCRGKINSIWCGWVACHNRH